MSKEVFIKVQVRNAGYVAVNSNTSFLNLLTTCFSLYNFVFCGIIT